MIDSIRAGIVEKLNAIIIDLDPNVTLRTKYGGTVFELRKNDPKSRVGSVYSYTDFFLLELSNGALFDDPKRVLEGAGKFRRHVNLRALNDIKSKCCGDCFLQQSPQPISFRTFIKNRALFYRAKGPVEINH